MTALLNPEHYSFHLYLHNVGLPKGRASCALVSQRHDRTYKHTVGLELLNREIVQ